MFVRSVIRRQAVFQSNSRTAADIAANTRTCSDGDLFPFLRIAAIPTIILWTNTFFPQERKVSDKWFN